MKLPFHTRPHRSITERLRTAEDHEEIERLLSEGAQFEDVAESTQSRWRRTAKKRRDELEGAE